MSAEDAYISIVAISLLLFFVALLKIVAFFSLSLRHRRQYTRLHPKKLSDGLPYISVIIPAYNEELTLANCVQSLLHQTYGHFEVIIVNDGSVDNTWQIAQQFAKDYPHIRAFAKENGGKASALNRGISEAHGDIVVCIDADSVFVKGTLWQLALSFEDPSVAAVGGNVRVINRRRLLSRFQALEYTTGLTLQRTTFAYLGCMQVISGAIGAFRKEALIHIEGYSNDTIVEDMDITIELTKRGYKVAYNPRAIAYTEAPETFRDFFKQRYRWTYGDSKL